MCYFRVASILYLSCFCLANPENKLAAENCQTKVPPFGYLNKIPVQHLLHTAVREIGLLEN